MTPSFNVTEISQINLPSRYFQEPIHVAEMEASMMIGTCVFKIARRIYRLLSKKNFQDPQCDLDRQSANDKIYRLLTADAPCMISRFGTVELGTVCNYTCIHSTQPFLKKIWNYVTDYTELPWWDDKHLSPMEFNAGVFPISYELCERFSERYLSDIPMIDLLGSFQYKEKFMPLSESVEQVHLETLYPFFVEHPWTRVLREKKVLVIHPFARTIQKQGAIRNHLFANKDVFPAYELLTYPAIQSAAGNRPPFRDWFDALHHMEQEIDKIDFDIAILGCGAYGLPLAAHIKRSGKKAIHLGGGTQLLFGIKGRRWENGQYRWTYKTQEKLSLNYEDLYNEYWIRPLKEETPLGRQKVEGGCYW